MSVWDGLSEDMSRTDLAEEIQRLRSEAAALRAAGDAQFRRVEQVSEGINDSHEFLSEILDDAVFAWRSAAGAPTAGAPAAAPTDAVTLLAGEFCPIDGCGAEGRLHTHERADYDRAVREVHDPAAAPADGQAPAWVDEIGLTPLQRMLQPPRPAPAAPADDTAAPDGPPTSVTVSLPVAEHDIDGEDEYGRWTQNPGWETKGIPNGLISAWTQGVSVEDELHDEGEVLDLEETAHKVLAAVAWHRHYAAQKAGR